MSILPVYEMAANKQPDKEAGQSAQEVPILESPE